MKNYKRTPRNIYPANPPGQHHYTHIIPNYGPRDYHYDDREQEDFSNYGRGGYSGNTYNQEEYNRSVRQSQRNDLYNTRPWGDEYSGWHNDPDNHDWSSWQQYLRNERMEQDGMHRGKGPKNYQRSDERIHDDIYSRLSEDPFLDATDIEIEVHAGEVILGGTVEDRDARRYAEDLVESIAGVKNVENRIRARGR
ncbi:BON domain-containing protein [Ohtaekwangia sp.]|uniref:BON domain-containing protein n=1 Tax=Ohtaekwangia sp. TaxID=2066019 RepID=UPI002F95AC5E